jgi:hypothetical protein
MGCFLFRNGCYFLKNIYCVISFGEQIGGFHCDLVLNLSFRFMLACSSISVIFYGAFHASGLSG